MKRPQKSQILHKLSVSKYSIILYPFKWSDMKMRSIILAVILFCGAAVQAQDSTKRKEVNITSTFKPALKDAAKINFNPSPPSADTARPRLQYTIPNQNLAFAFQPGSLKPLALQVDTGGKWTNENYV